jgi:hypothetical protein
LDYTTRDILPTYGIIKKWILTYFLPIGVDERICTK